MNIRGIVAIVFGLGLIAALVAASATEDIVRVNERRAIAEQANAARIAERAVLQEKTNANAVAIVLAFSNYCERQHDNVTNYAARIGVNIDTKIMEREAMAIGREYGTNPLRFCKTNGYVVKTIVNAWSR